MAIGGEENKPLTSAQLLFGESLPETIARDIYSRGLAFRPSSDLRALPTDAGADAKVLTAFNEAKPGVEPDHTPTESLKHLATAGNLMRSKNHAGATRELDNATKSEDDTAAAFLMGAILTEQQQSQMASKVYRKILEPDSNFPEAHTKLSFVLYTCSIGYCEPLFYCIGPNIHWCKSERRTIGFPVDSPHEPRRECRQTCLVYALMNQMKANPRVENKIDGGTLPAPAPAIPFHMPKVPIRWGLLRQNLFLVTTRPGQPSRFRSDLAVIGEYQC